MKRALLLFFLIHSIVGAERLRVIIETDAGGDPDDEQSLVRFLLYVNEWDVEGIIANRSKARDGENKNKERTGLGVVQQLVRAYGECWPNLVQHDPRFPKVDTLLARTVLGYDDTDDAVKLILHSVDANDPRPIWYSDWGTDHGAATNNLRRALDRVLKERGQEGYAKFKSKIRLVSHDTLMKDHNERAPAWTLWVNTWMPAINNRRWYHQFSAITAKAGGFDLKRDVLENHGALGALYPTNTTHWQKEGDTPSFLYWIPTGMNEPNFPWWGSWAGRYGLRDDFPGRQNYWANQVDEWNGSTNRDNTLRRWAVDLQNDFRARLDWCVKGPKDANHPPRVRLNGKDGNDIVYLDCKPGQWLDLDARGSSDPDGNALEYTWFIYGEAGTCQGRGELVANGPTARLRVPESEIGRTVHVIVTVRDNGHPALARYRRAVIQVPL